MGSLSRATNKTTSMRAPGLSLLAAVVISVSDALSTLNGRVDEEHNAIVVEALRARSGRAFSWFSGTPSSPFAGMFPAATQPLAPATQQVLCLLPRLQAEGLDRQDHQGLLRSSSASQGQLQLEGENISEFAIKIKTATFTFETYLRLFQIQPMFTIS